MASNDVESRYVAWLAKNYGGHVFTPEKRHTLNSSSYDWNYNGQCSVMTPKAEIRMIDRWRKGR